MKGLTCFIILVSLQLTIAELNPIEELFSRSNINYLQDVLDVGSPCWSAINASSEITKLKMFDASSKIPSGLLSFNGFDLGNFDECYNLEDVVNDEAVYGKYCLGTIPIPSDLLTKRSNEDQNVRALGGNNVGVHLAYCLLSSCTVEDFSKIPFSNFNEKFCYSQATKPELDSSDITAIVILGVFATIVIISTGYDLHLYYNESKPSHPMQIAFSLWSNGRKIFRTTSGGDQLSCINGIKALSMAWVIYGHVNSKMLGSINYEDVLNYMKDNSNMYMLNAPVSVDTFYAIAGLLTVYTFLKANDKGVKFSIPMFYVHRYLRLTPALAVIVLLNATLYRHMGNGPFWGLTEGEVDNCRNYWWSALLYIQNYVNPEKMCVGQSWYLSVDTQLFVLSPAVLLLLIWYPKIARVTLGVLILAGNIVPFVITYTMDLPATLSSTGRTSLMEYFKYYYVQTYSRFGPYVIGMLFGWIIYNLRKKDLIQSMDKSKINWLVVTTWIVALAILGACLYGGADVVTEEEDSLVARSFYNGFHRNGWALGVCLMTTLCSIGYGGSINGFLSIPLFQILSKLSYSMYLVHFSLVISQRFYSAKVLYYFSVGNIFQAFFGDFIVTLVYSFFLCTIFESPIITIEKFIFGDLKKSPEKSPA